MVALVYEALEGSIFILLTCSGQNTSSLVPREVYSESRFVALLLLENCTSVFHLNIGCSWYAVL